MILGLTVQLLNSTKMAYTTTPSSKATKVKRTSAEQAVTTEELVNKYPIITIEDGMDETTGMVENY